MAINKSVEGLSINNLPDFVKIPDIILAASVNVRDWKIISEKLTNKKVRIMLILFWEGLLLISSVVVII